METGKIEYEGGFTAELERDGLLAVARLAGPKGLLGLHYLDNSTVKVELYPKGVKVVATLIPSKAFGGEIALGAKGLIAALKSIPKKAVIRITEEGGKTSLWHGATAYRLIAQEVPEYSDEGIYHPQTVLSLPAEGLRSILSAVAYAQAKKDVRTYLNGTFLEARGEYLHAIATDGHRLAQASTSLSAPVKAEGFVLPSGFVALLQKIPSKPGQLATIEAGRDEARVTIGAYEITSKIIWAGFPDYWKSIDGEGPNVAIADRDSLIAALRRVEAIASQDRCGTKVVILDVDQASLGLRLCGEDDAAETLPIEFVGGPVFIGFNVAYLLDAVRGVQAERVRVAFVDKDTRCWIRADEEESHAVGVVMPVRI